MSVFLAISLVVLAVLAIVGFGPSIAERARRHVPKRRPAQERKPGGADQHQSTNKYHAAKHRGPAQNNHRQ